MHKNRYMELKYYCRRYDELSADEKRLIQELALQAANDVKAVAECIVASVRSYVTYEMMSCPCGRRQFYEAKRRFYDLLNEKKR